MQHISTAFLIIALVIVVNNGQGVTVEDDGLDKSDQVAAETKRNALTVIDGPKYVAKQPEPTQPPTVTVTNNHKPEQRPPSKPPIFPDKPGQHKYYVDLQRPYYGNIQQIQSRPLYSQPLKLFQSQNSLYNFPKVIPLPHNKNHYFLKQQPRPTVIYTPNNNTVTTKPPKFSIPVQTITGVRKDITKLPKIKGTSNVGTTTVASLTTTKRYLRTKRIWPKKILEKMNSTAFNSNKTSNYTNLTNITHKSDYDQSPSITRVRYIFKNDSLPRSSPTRRPYRPVTRVPKKRSTTPAINITDFENTDWVPIVPSHYRYRRPQHSRNRRSLQTPAVRPINKRLLYLQSFGLVPMPNLEDQELEQEESSDILRKKMAYSKRERHTNTYYPGYVNPSYRKPATNPYIYGDLQAQGSHIEKHIYPPRVITKIKHHHHHHHHRYIKTVEKPIEVPYKVEVPKPYPVTVEKKVPVPVEKVKIVEKPVPYPVTVEKKVPYPIGIKVPHPVPYKVVEKEYVPKPYPVVHHVPVAVEKKVLYPVEVRVPVDRPVPVAVEKQVPYPVPVKVLVPQPYPVETKVPVPVKVKEPVEVVKHVPVKVPYPQPFAVNVPVPVEKKVPYPVEVEKRIPVPVEIYVPQKVEVEKKVPVYIAKPFPVETKVPVPVKIPYPIRVPVYVTSPNYNDYYGSSVSVSPASPTNTPEHTVTVHGNTGFAGFQSRSDNSDTTTSESSSTTPLTSTNS